MATSSKKTKKAGKEVPAAKRWAEKADFVFNVAQFIRKEEVLDHSLLKIDEDQSYGQVRGLDMKHVAKLAEDFKMNPPVSITLTVWRHPGL